MKIICKNLQLAENRFILHVFCEKSTLVKLFLAVLWIVFFALFDIIKEKGQKNTFQDKLELCKKPKGCEKVYTAMNIASEIIRQYGEHQKPITNLKLQKILYYVQTYSLQNSGHALFDDDFQAWRHGPVIPEVYDIFRKYVSDDIKKDDQTVLSNRVEIDETSKSMVEKIVEKTLPLDAWDMVYKTHETRPWKDTYIPNMNCIITKEQIRRDGEVNLS